MVQLFENETMKEPYKLLIGEIASWDHSILLARSQHYVRYEIIITTLPLFSNRRLQGPFQISGKISLKTAKSYSSYKKQTGI